MIKYRAFVLEKFRTAVYSPSGKRSAKWYLKPEATPHKGVIIISGKERNGGTHCDWPVDGIGHR